MQILGKILGSEARVKIMRLFLVSGSQVFEGKEVAKRSRVSTQTARKELSLLFSVGFIKKTRKGWFFNQSFRYAAEMERLLVEADVMNKDVLARAFKKTGKVKLLLVAGAFTKDKESRVDMLIVGDKIRRRAVEEGLKKIEAEIGQELSYALFDTTEFIYRLNMYDKLVRDILDFPHQVIIESKELNLKNM